jgi:hypothetical protein
MNQGFHEDFGDEPSVEEREGYQQMQEQLHYLAGGGEPVEEFVVEYTTTHRVKVSSARSTLGDAIANIPIPENEDGGKYVPDTFEVTSVARDDGTEIPIEDV